MDIPIFYDPMIAKLIVHGKDRTEAIDKMLRAISDYEITGLETTLGFCAFALKHEAFVSGKFDTGFIKTHFTPDMLLHSEPKEEEAAAIFGAHLYKTLKAKTMVSQSNGVKNSKWYENRTR